ncbi:biopolymer transporter ExbD [Lentisphaera profundi]|uniref:Biopolymer transporter ExbD n=1 Tax=Lentisphaera profundi TaxID=1658616 RepID=A0ABY7VY15_9BACT|nr:biopolymer transporter ExbD [Lentisphaera profundi]WDE96958.1 biopolymer transporter ExbD [Lentisphaera profundi]
MAKKKKRLKVVVGDTELPLSAMIDVTFLLLTYFLITNSPVIEEAHVAVNAPSHSPDITILTDANLDLMVMKDHYHLPSLGHSFKHASDMNEFIATYAKNTAGSSSKICLKLEGNAKTEQLINIIDLLAKEGLEDKLTIAFLN